MLERHDTHENRETPRSEPTARDAADRARAERPMLDREVPLPGVASDSLSMAGLHQWLDDERAAADVVLDPAQAALWSKISAETTRRRQVTAPAGFMDRVMAALPEVDTAAETVAETQLATTVTTTVTTTVAPAAGVPLSMALIIGTVLLAVGMLIGRLIA